MEVFVDPCRFETVTAGMAFGSAWPARGGVALRLRDAKGRSLAKSPLFGLLEFFFGLDDLLVLRLQLCLQGIPLHEQLHHPVGLANNLIYQFGDTQTQRSDQFGGDDHWHNRW